MPNDGDIRLSGGQYEVYDSESGRWWSLATSNPPVEAYLRRNGITQANFFDLVDPTTFALLPQLASPGQASGGQAQAGGKPEWWDSLMAVVPELPPFEELGIKKSTDARGIPTESFDIGLAEQQLEKGRNIAISLGIIPEEQDAGPQQPTREELEASIADFPGWEVVPDGRGGFVARERPQDGPPKAHASIPALDAYAASLGYPKNSYTAVQTPTGWVMKINEATGQIYPDFQQANRNAPPGYRPYQLTNGMWAYELIPEPAQQGARSWDELILRAFDEGGQEAALRIDRIRDMVEQPNQRITIQDALQFGFQAATIGGSFDAAVFKQIVGLVQQLTPGGMTDPFAATVQQASTAFEQAVNEPTGAQFANQPPEVQDAIRRQMARAEADEAVFAQGPFDDQQDETKAFDDAFTSAFERLREEQDLGMGTFTTGPDPTTDPLELAVSRGAEVQQFDGFSGVDTSALTDQQRDNFYGPAIAEHKARVAREKVPPPAAAPADPFAEISDAISKSVSQKEQGERQKRQAVATTRVG